MGKEVCVAEVQKVRYRVVGDEAVSRWRQVYYGGLCAN